MKGTSEKVSTGSLSERLIMRTRSTRGSVRETLSKAIRSTLRRSSSSEMKSMPDLPTFGTALTAMTSRTSSDERNSESGEGSPMGCRVAQKDCARIYFNSTSSEQSSRSSSSTPHRVRQTTSSSGFGSMSHLPPIQYRRNLDPFSSSMSQSMYEQPISQLSHNNEYKNAISRSRNFGEDSSETWVPSSPSLATLKDFMFGNDDEYDNDCDYDDVKSVISSASTSRIFSLDRKTTRYNKNQSLRQFLNSPVRLRKRSDARREAVEAGFEPSDGVPRCHSTQSLKEVQRTKSYNKSQFQASDLSLNPNGRVVAPCDSTTGNIAPTAIVSPTAIPHYRLSKAVHSRSTYDHQADLNNDADRRRSLQTLTGASSLYQMTNGRSQFTPTEDLNTRQHQGTRVRVSSVNQINDSASSQHYKLDQRRSVHNLNNPVRSSFVEGIKTTSTPKNQIAVAPLAHKSRHLSESRDEMRTERRGSGGGMNLPAYHSYLMKHSGEERLVDGPVNTPSDARIAYLEQRIRELEVNQKEQQKQMTPVQPRHSRSSQFHSTTNGNMSTSEQLKMQEMHDDLVTKDRKVAQLEGKLLKAYQRIERLNEEFEIRVNTMIYDGERAKEDLTRCVDKIRQLESELSSLQNSAQNGDHANEQVYHELRDKIWKQERELQEHRVMLSRLREKESEFEKMRSEKGYLELKNENLKEKLEAKKRAIDELERSVSTLRLEQTICQQSCSSGSTPLADECETMSDIRPSIARPYTKAHSTLGSNNMSPLPHSKSTGLTKSFSNFALNSSKRDDITPMMSRSIREQNRHITMCRAMVVCLKDTLEKLARGENPDVARLLGVKLNMMSESELDEDDQEAEESKPFSMMAAESALSKQCQKLSDLDNDLDTIRCQLAEFHGHNDVEGDGDREVCRVQ